MKQVIHFFYHRLGKGYIRTFQGLSREVWWLALITLINRSGTMVIPFLSLYLRENLEFTVPQIGWIMSCFGLGSVVGSWLGGKLTDIIGFYKVMVYSLLLTGILFIGLQYVDTFVGLCLGIFLVMLVADSFRPAIFVALNAYSKPENKTRSVTLIRLAINLGFSAGPAIGGIIITSVGYAGLFWIDGITCIAASFVLINVLHPKKARILDSAKSLNPVSAYSDRPFLIFLVAMVLFGWVFLQYFSTVPLYYKDGFGLNEFKIGLLLGLNGILIFLLEMPLIKWLDHSGKSKIALMIISSFLVGLSFVMLLIPNFEIVLIIGIILMTVGEMILFPFSNAFALERAKKGRQGEYMALYSISFSISHIFAHNSGMQSIAAIGYEKTWLAIIFLALICVFLLLQLRRSLVKEATYER
ncbi:MFS transporter [Aegicerativicinus sediminis]